MEKQNINISKAILAATATDSKDAERVWRMLDELERLLETAGGRSVGRVLQLRSSPDSATYLGSGKLAELRSLCAANEVGLVVFDSELTPSQIRNIEEALGGNVDVIDR